MIIIALIVLAIVAAAKCKIEKRNGQSLNKWVNSNSYYGECGRTTRRMAAASLQMLNELETIQFIKRQPYRMKN